MIKSTLIFFLFSFLLFFYVSCESNKNDKETVEQNKIRLQIDEINYKASKKQWSKDYIGAINLYNESLKLDNRNFDALANQAFAFFDNGDFVKAIQNCTILIDEKKQIDEVYSKGQFYSLRGKAKYNLGDFLGALSDFDYILNGGNGGAFYNEGIYRGMTYLKLNRTTEACLDFSKAGQNGRKEAYELISKYCN